MAKKQPKRRRRANGEGTIVELPAGKWRAVLTVGRRDDGRLVRRTKTCRTHADAVAALDQLRRARDSVGVPTHLTLSGWLTVWLLDHEPKIAAGTLRYYKRSVAAVPPDLAHMRLGDITRQHAIHWQTWLAGQLPTSQQLQAWAICRAALNEAVRRGLLAKNPLDGVERPKHRGRKIHPFSRSEMLQILEWFEDTRLYELFLLAFSSGMRIGELVAIEWRDVDCDERLVRVRRHRSDEDGQASRAPKSEAGVRTIPIPDQASQALAELRERRPATQATDKSLCFIGQRGARLYTSNIRGTHWKQCLHDLAIEHRGIHHTRHTFATLAINAGVPITVVSRILGHTKVSLTLDTYAHALDADMTRARSVVSALLTPDSDSSHKS